MLMQALESQSGVLSLLQMVEEMFICMADCSAARYLTHTDVLSPPESFLPSWEMAGGVRPA